MMQYVFLIIRMRTNPHKRKKWLLFVRNKYGFILFASLIMLFGCGEEPPKKIEIYPMVSWDEKGLVKQLYTYGGDPVIKKDVYIDGRQIKTKENTVYINHQSQIVYKDGEPILGPFGYYVFWEKEGRFVNTQYKQIHESRIFALDGKPMPDKTAILIKTYFDEAKTDYQVRQKRAL